MIQNLRYPAAARQAGITGDVVISAKIDAQGNLDSLFFVESPDKQLTDADINAMHALQDQWKTEFLVGKSFDKKYLFHFKFQLDSGQTPLYIELKRIDKLLTKGSNENAISQLDKLAKDNSYSASIFELRAKAYHQLDNLEAYQKEYMRAKYLNKELLSTIMITGMAL